VADVAVSDRLSLQKLEIVEDGSDRIPDLVCDPRRHPPDGAELLGPKKARLRFAHAPMIGASVGSSERGRRRPRSPAAIAAAASLNCSNVEGSARLRVGFFPDRPRALTNRTQPAPRPRYQPII
jgi:hypothetical protein